MIEIHFKNGSVIEAIETKHLEYMIATNKDEVLANMSFISNNSYELYTEYIRKLKNESE